MLVMLLSVKIHILVKIEVLAVSLIPEGLVVHQGGECAGSGTLVAHSWSC